MNLKEDVIDLIDQSIADNFLDKREKKKIKEALKTLNPDKRISDFLRSQLFDIAKNRVNNENYLEVINWIEGINKLILAANKYEVQQESVYFSPGEECLQAILMHIKSSVNRIKICLFTISDDRISEALITKHNHGVMVLVITDNDKLFDKGSDIETLKSAGIAVRIDNTDSHMHHKFALFDDTITLTGSYNWTRSAERYNHENILITDSKKVAREFDREFNQLWKQFPEL
ncbi:phospholipase D-like domain-containing protein [Crocinitomix algicola]|uniref:phospholipase D-like domain-containing protein n=1 Tax=Crocinitomix algicola TaxID=1740263 RepID=UPI000835AD83|nr:phospholipase D-like domain-containing protein [Crocinitomix algicola]